MGSLVRGFKNAFRNPIRTVSIVIILGISIGFALSMLTANRAVNKKIESVKGSIGNIINISPAGTRGFEGGGEPLTEDQVNKVTLLAHVAKVTKNLNTRLDSSSTNIQSAIDAGTLGNRNRSESGSSGNSSSRAPEGAPGGGNFTPPVMLLGTNDPTSLSSLGGSKIVISSGTALDINQDNTAIIGKAIADKNSLTVGSTFMAYNTMIKVVGIFTSSTDDRFSGNAVVMPLKTVQTISSQAGEISSATVQIDSISNMSSAISEIKAALGATADVVSQEDTSSQALSPLESVKNISIFSLIAALVTGAIIILLTMLMIVRERRREIGVLKAIGAGNAKITFQFVSESITLSFLGSIVGLAIGIIASNPLTNLLIQTNSSTAQPGMGGGPGGGGMMRFAAQNLVDVKNIQASIGWEAIVFGLVAVILIAIVGSAIPSWLIAKVKPAEVMRSE